MAVNTEAKDNTKAQVKSKVVTTSEVDEEIEKAAADTKVAVKAKAVEESKYKAIFRAPSPVHTVHIDGSEYTFPEGRLMTNDDELIKKLEELGYEKE